MTEQIVTIDHIRARARAAFEAGLGPDAHHMNWNAAALPTWQAEYDRCAAEAEQPELAEAES